MNCRMTPFLKRLMKSFTVRFPVRLDNTQRQHIIFVSHTPAIIQIAYTSSAPIPKNNFHSNVESRVKVIFARKMRLLSIHLATFNIVFQNVVVLACVGEPLVQTRAGKVRGVNLLGSEGDEFCAFKGIPYAKPPVGELRFRDPEPADPWTDVLDATNFGPMCVQHDWITGKVMGVEDCLYLNVYTKSTEPKVKRPVMVWIHGGGFTAGSADDNYYGPDYFMRKDIVLVAMNYRLGIFGFLNLDDELASGNQGLKDQLLALHWVRDNIENFGGNPDDVTIFGSSTGGAAVHFHTISPLSRGLFRKAICQSGTMINPWVFHTTIKERTLRLCDSLGHKEQDVKSVIQFLKTADVQKINKAQRTLLTKEEKIQGMFTFGPSIDSKSKNPILPVHPRIAAAAGIQVPLLIGHNTREGLLFIRSVSAAVERFNNEFNELLHPDVASIAQEYGLTMESLKQVYFKNGSIAKENLDVLIDLYSDLYFVEGVDKIMKIQAEKSPFPTYFYQFTYDKEPSATKVWFHTKMSGSCHADDLFFLFRFNGFASKLKFPEKGSERYRISEQMVEMWVNFATTGNPTPKPTELIPFEWQPISNGTVFPYMNICENLRMDAVTNLEQKFKAH